MRKLFMTFMALLVYLFIGFNEVSASTVNIEDSTKIEQTEEMNSDNNEKKEIKLKKSSQDLFGDEQTFPFVAGLGKNAAH